MNEQFKPEELREQWNRFCETHDEDRWADIAARIDEEAAGVVTPVPKKRSRGRTVATVASICAAAVVTVTVGFPLLGNGMAMLLGGNSAAPDEELNGEEIYTTQDGWDGLLDDFFSKDEADPEAPGDAAEDGSSADGELRGDTALDGDDSAGEVESGAAVDDSTTSTEPTYTEPTRPTQVPVRPYPSGEGTGGDIYDGDFCYIGGFKHSGLMNYFLDYARQNVPEKVDAAIEKIAQMCTPTSYTFIGDSMHFYVRELDISRETFVELNERSKEFFGDNEWDLAEFTYTDEEIDDIYNLSIKEFNEKYKAPTAVAVGEYIYAFDWLYKNDINLWKKQNFTVEQLQDAVANANTTPNFPQDIILVVEEKLILFAAEKAGVTVPNSGDGRYNTYISHARWRGIGDAYYQYILQNHSQEAIDAFEALLYEEFHGEDYAFKGGAINRWVAHFHIPRADFEKINQQQREYYKTTYGEDSFEYLDNVYTDEEIDDIYTLSLQEFNMKYANPCTLVVGEELYPFGWFLENRMSKWWEELEIREKYLEALLVEFKKVYPDESEDIDNYAEKLEDYINNHGK